MSAKPGKVVVQSDAGAYLAWPGADQPGLAVDGLGCGLLVLKPLGLALPHYADSNKFGYMLSGTGLAGVLPLPLPPQPAGHDASEKVVRLADGDLVAVRTGEVSWWYNDGEDDDADMSIVFMADTAGALGQKLLVCPRERDREGLVVRVASGKATAEELASLDGLGISAVVGRIEAGGAGRAPWVVRDGAAQAVYVARGSARVQVSSSGGGDTLAVDEVVSAGSLFVVPRFAVACLVAAGAGRRRGVGVADQERKAGGGAPDQGGLGARRGDAGGRAGRAGRGARAGRAARSGPKSRPPTPWITKHDKSMMVHTTARRAARLLSVMPL
ncbi:hypothetical protein BRADI_4g37310v3 [Brachypodium distachyon]|uniref:Cupin type-1 domain-containing protein n=1 Tax=Brachypodium distachyon TaxID=15368 RepID=A0A2K2CSW0_BRADI|nr:hypothetical protein BRADI_4g37310v3 [Brachypodium distachyon]